MLTCPLYFKMNFFDQNSAPAISGNLANYTFRRLLSGDFWKLRSFMIHLATTVPGYSTWLLAHCHPGWIAWHSSRQMNDLSFHESPDNSQISYFLLCNYIDLFIPVAIATRVSQAVQSCPESPLTSWLVTIWQRPYYLTWTATVTQWDLSQVLHFYETVQASSCTPGLVFLKLQVKALFLTTFATGNWCAKLAHFSRRVIVDTGLSLRLCPM